MADVNNTERDIGRLQGQMESVNRKLDALSEMIQEQNRIASEGRRHLHDRVGHLETSIQIVGQAEGQIRDSIKSLEAQVQETDAKFNRRIDKEVMPTVDEVRRWKITGMTVLSMAGVAGASIGAFMYWAWDVIVSKWQGGP